jgi:predicted HTH transcriptional regulator
MEYLVLFLAGVLALLLVRRKTQRVAYRQSAQRQRIEQRKVLIVEYLKHSGRITNDEAQDLLSISDTTATEYLDELEAEGKVQQVGKTGRGVHYVTR